MVEGDVWKCDCGNIAYGENPPAECTKCGSLNTFALVPEDMVQELEDNYIVENLPQGDSGEEDED
jgi:hypothetical protein